MSMMKIDMHTHTLEGSPCSRVPVKVMVDRLIEKGFAGVLITDHESIAGFQHYKKLYGSQQNLVVLCGFEYTTTLGDMLVILPTQEVIPYKDTMTPFALIDLVHEKGGAIGIAHMFRDSISIGNNAQSYEEIEAIVKKVDFIEVQNKGASADANVTALWWATQYFKSQTKGSDSHDIKDIGATGTIFTVPIQNEIDLINAIREGKMIKEGL